MEIEELVAAYRADRRHHDDGRPWVMLNMIASLDGAVEVDGLSEALGNEADFAVFIALRRLADVILVGAGTAMAESYQPPTTEAAVVADRAERGQAPRPTIALVSRRLAIDPEAPIFSDPTYRPTVVTTTDADPVRRERLADVADIVTAGTGAVDLRDAVRRLAADAGPTVLAEGGPTLNGQLAADDLLDEVCLTLSPLIVGGTGGRMLANGSAHSPRAFRLDRVATAGGLVFTRSLRQR